MSNTPSDRERKGAYVTPQVQHLGAWSALTLQFSQITHLPGESVLYGSMYGTVRPDDTSI